jgi:HEPN domain-containing protein
VTNGERADQLFSEARRVAAEMRTALEPGGWNLALRRAQEVIELVIKAVLNEMGVESPRVHDPAPLFVDVIRARRVETDPAFLEWLKGLSADLANLRAPAFYQEIAVSEAKALDAVRGAERVLEFGGELLARLRDQ